MKKRQLTPDSLTKSKPKTKSPSKPFKLTSTPTKNSSIPKNPSKSKSQSKKPNYPKIFKNNNIKDIQLIPFTTSILTTPSAYSQRKITSNISPLRASSIKNRQILQQSPQIYHPKEQQKKTKRKPSITNNPKPPNEIVNTILKAKTGKNSHLPISPANKSKSPNRKIVEWNKKVLTLQKIPKTGQGPSTFCGKPNKLRLNDLERLQMKQLIDSLQKPDQDTSMKLRLRSKLENSAEERHNGTLGLIINNAEPQSDTDNSRSISTDRYKLNTMRLSQKSNISKKIIDSEEKFEEKSMEIFENDKKRLEQNRQQILGDYSTAEFCDADIKWATISELSTFKMINSKLESVEKNSQSKDLRKNHDCKRSSGDTKGLKGITESSYDDEILIHDSLQQNITSFSPQDSLTDKYIQQEEGWKYMEDKRLQKEEEISKNSQEIQKNNEVGKKVIQELVDQENERKNLEKELKGGIQQSIKQEEFNFTISQSIDEQEEAQLLRKSQEIVKREGLLVQKAKALANEELLQKRAQDEKEFRVKAEEDARQLVKKQVMEEYKKGRLGDDITLVMDQLNHDMNDKVKAIVDEQILTRREIINKANDENIDKSNSNYSQENCAGEEQSNVSTKEIEYEIVIENADEDSPLIFQKVPTNNVIIDEFEAGDCLSENSQNKKSLYVISEKDYSKEIYDSKVEGQTGSHPDYENIKTRLDNCESKSSYIACNLDLIAEAIEGCISEAKKIPNADGTPTKSITNPLDPLTPRDQNKPITPRSLKEDTTIYYKDGSMYTGNTLNGLRQGKGTSYHWNGKKKYCGNFKDDKQNGEGIGHWLNGNVSYRGNWINDTWHGYGIKYDIDGREACRGYWENDNLIKLDYKAKNSIIIDKGISFQDSDGFTKQYMGETKNGVSNGYGTTFDKKGNKIYKGDWVENKRHGNGTLYNQWGDNEYCGEWKNDRKCGYGVQYDLEGKIEYIGMWKDGKPVKQNNL